MKAAQINSYGGPEIIEIREISKPSLKEGQILVEVDSASINAIDWKIRLGYMKKMIPLTFPITLGGDFAGKVVEVSESVTDFKVGDEVYGNGIIINKGSGSIAEFVAANAANTSLKPKSVNNKEASALPLVGTSAIQAIEDHINLQSGQKILIHGGAGGIGHVAIQFAKSLGAYVATTVKTEDIEFVKELGADEVIDYTKQNFEEILKDFDGVLDNVGGETTTKSVQVLKNGGVLVSLASYSFDKELLTKYGVKGIAQQTKTDTSHLKRLAELVDAEKIKIKIDKVFSLDQIKEAFTYQEQIHPKGKVVIKIK